MSEISIVPLDDAEFTFATRPWSFADRRRAGIKAHFAARLRKNPGMWNGRVLLAHEYSLQSKSLQVNFFETDFASFIAWWDWDFPDPTITNCFSMGAIRAADGAFLLGVMNAHTARAGSIYFPAGIPEPSDITDGKVDLAGHLFREVEEEAGLPSTHFAAEPGWTAVRDGRVAALMRVLQADEAAVDLRGRILSHLASERAPELADIRIVRSPADFDPMMPEF